MGTMVSSIPSVPRALIISVVIPSFSRAVAQHHIGNVQYVTRQRRQRPKELKKLTEGIAVTLDLGETIWGKQKLRRFKVLKRSHLENSSLSRASKRFAPENLDLP